MSSKGNRHLERNPELENALVLLKADQEGAWALEKLDGALAALLEQFTDMALGARGEDAMRAIGAMGALREVRRIIADADGKKPEAPEGEEARAEWEAGE